MNWDEKVVIVTGAASGIGRAAALRFGREGAMVVVSDVAVPGMTETVDHITAHGGRAIAVEADVSSRPDVERMVATAMETYGRVDVMIANAGVGGGQYHFLETPDEVWDRVIAVNLKGVFLCGQVAARAMVAGGHGGAIVTTASIDAEIAQDKITPYNSSKGGVRMLTKSMALELGPYGIRANAVAPGAIRTGMNRMEDPEQVRRIERAVPLRRVGLPEDVADVMVFLASDEARYITGDMIYVDGGIIVR
jgi:NAD(P)-dependent dehydrogenase (short-subunit alcohol dehydrogenase family)